MMQQNKMTQTGFSKAITFCTIQAAHNAKLLITWKITWHSSTLTCSVVTKEQKSIHVMTCSGQKCQFICTDDKKLTTVEFCSKAGPVKSHQHTTTRVITVYTHTWSNSDPHSQLSRYRFKHYHQPVHFLPDQIPYSSSSHHCLHWTPFGCNKHVTMLPLLLFLADP